jgi:predicted methyltransferase
MLVSTHEHGSIYGFTDGACRAVYAIEATCHAPSWEDVYGQIFKILKPGGVVSLTSTRSCFSISNVLAVWCL